MENLDDFQDEQNESLFSREGEQSVIGGLMLNNEAWDDVREMIDASDFYFQRHQILFSTMERLITEKQPLDPVTLGESLEQAGKLSNIGGGHYLGILASNTPSAANILAYAEIVKNRSIIRKLSKLGNDVLSLIKHPNGMKTDEMLDFVENSVLSIGETTKDFAIPPFFEVVTETIETIDRLSQLDNPITGLPTGFKKLDEETAGLQPSDFIIVAGRPSMGKTAFVLNICLNLLKLGHPILFFSLEMSRTQLSLRLLASEAKINLQKLRTGKLDELEHARLREAVGVIESLPFYIDDRSQLDPIEMRMTARKIFRREGGLSLIVIDYLQLMCVKGADGFNKNAEVSKISRAMKGLARELNIPVIALSQLNRSLEQRTDKRPKMSDLRESGALEQDSDSIYFIYRDEIYNEGSFEIGTAQIIIGKQRNGPIGMTRLYFEGEHVLFSDCDSDIYDDYHD